MILRAASHLVAFNINSEEVGDKSCDWLGMLEACLGTLCLNFKAVIKLFLNDDDDDDIRYSRDGELLFDWSKRHGISLHYHGRLILLASRATTLYRRAHTGFTMSLVLLSHVCSHLQNASKARLGLTSIPFTLLHLRLAQALQNSGYLSSVTRGGLAPPDPLTLHTHIPPPITQSNVATQRLWLGLKYWNNEPVLRKLSMESKPTRRIWVDRDLLANVVRGKHGVGKGGIIKGLAGVGESLFVTTDRGVLEARECVERRLGGMVLCRAE